MASALAGDDLLARSMSSGRSYRSWTSASFKEVWQAPPEAFGRSGRQDEEEEELRWAAIERLPTYDRLRKGMLTQILDNGKVVHHEVDVAKLGMQAKKQLMASMLKVVEEDNEKFLRRLRDRTDRVGIEIPTIEVRFQHLEVEGDVYVGSRALPTLLNVTLNTIESILGLLRLAPSKKRKNQILKDVSGIVKPSRMTLLLGPPGAGKTTLLMALAGKLDRDLRSSGKVTYCGHDLNEFVPQRTCAYISQHDLHYGEMTVRETLDFSGRCLGVGTRYEMLSELSRREKEVGIKPDPEIDAFMKATAVAGQETSLVTDYILKILGLDICADIMVGDDMRRGISGGQKKRVTTGEMLGPAKALFMDEISTGLDSSTTFQICKFMRQMVHTMDVTMIISLLQPEPKTFDLFDDVIVLSECQIVYQGPRESVLDFFEFMGFKCPERKGIADFLQEVTSKKDQQQYWFQKSLPYGYVSVSDFVNGFSCFRIGQQLSMDLKVPYDKTSTHPAALVTKKYGISNWELVKACFAREWLLMKRNSFGYNPATWMLEVSAPSVEAQLDVDFADIYANSSLYRYVQMQCQRSGNFSPLRLAHHWAQFLNFTNFHDEPRTYQRAQCTSTWHQGSLLPNTIFSAIPHPMQGMLLETTLVLLEEPSIQCHQVFHDNSYRHLIWYYLLEQRTTDIKTTRSDESSRSNVFSRAFPRSNQCCCCSICCCN
uniref:ABC transporter domain-containing protein n=1 Tax=Gossypium raimondii TaxID=29730 RepID=A0A0D2SYM4_GOSRA|nr:hypothetical protein B456_006G157200 [Gossypium raimondii]